MVFKKNLHMKALITGFSKSFYLIIALSLSNLAHSQCIPAYGTEFSIYISNILYTSDRSIEFDVRIMNTGSQPFELATVQCGINVNNSLYYPGTLTVSIVPGYSDLVAAQVPTTVAYTGTGSPPPCVIKLAPRPAPGSGLGSTISTGPSGNSDLRIVRLKINSDIPFNVGGPEFIFQPNTAVNPQYPTKVAKYNSGVVNPMPVSMGVNAFICYNSFGWNPIPYPVTGGGSYCQGGAGLPVGLANSQSGVGYILLKDGVAQSPITYSAGGAFSFGNQFAGTYTIIGVVPNVPGSTMIGNAVIAEIPSVAASVNITSDANYTCPGTTVTFSASPTGGGTSPSFQWFVNNVLFGSGPSYSYTPADGDLVYVTMTSNETCSSGSPATSNSIQMEVNEPATKAIVLSSLFIEGLYNGSGTLRQAYDESGPHFEPGIADRITVELHDAAAYNNPVAFSSTVNLNTNGIAIISLPDTYTGLYYITIRHRNSIATVSALPISFNSCTIYYAFSQALKAYGNNLRYMENGQYAIYSGDIDQNGIIDSGDMTSVDNGASNYETGYLSADVNGDGLLDSSDMTILDNNSAAFIGSITP
jgi:hypothetical protein